MGLLRYFLAIVVVIGHASPTGLSIIPLDGDGGLAVSCFFVISGFYMTLIAEKYQLQTLTINNLKRFYLSRFFRIYPLYVICVTITLILSWFKITYIGHEPSAAVASLNNIQDKILYIFSNMFIFGQDLMRFMIYDPSTHRFFIYFMAGAPKFNPILWGSGYQILGQSWTLAIELCFYIVAPFIVTRRPTIVVLVCTISFCLRYFLYYSGYISYNISTGFFPTALGVFLLGVIAYKCMYVYVDKMPRYIIKPVGILLISGLLIYAAYYYNFIENIQDKFWSFLLMVALSVPFLFASFKDSKIDNFIGELSYPVYMIQFVCFAIIYKTMHVTYPVLYIIILCTLLSIAIDYLLIKPLDRLRHGIFARKAYDNEKKLYSNGYGVTQLPLI